METTIIITRIFATVWIAFGLGMLMSPKFYKEEIGKLLVTPSFIFLSGFLGIIFGVIITTTHHYWENDWRMIITIFGWIALIKGILLIIAPKQAEGFRYSLLKPENTKKIAYLLLVLGAVFGYLGFFH